MKRWTVALAATLSVAGAAPAKQEAAPSFDVVIRNGRVLDGFGNPWVKADIAISGGRFVAIGKVSGRGRREIDAGGKYVSPGWIDIMDQSGDTLLVNGAAENKLREGVTSAVGGEGGTPVPSAQVGGYFAKLQRQGIGINFGSFYSATQARTEVMGDGAGHPTPVQLKDMQGRVAVAMKGGAMGITTALVYPPDSFHATSDLVALAQVAGRYGGIYASHIRDENAGLLGAVGEAIEIGEKGGVPVEIFHLKAAWKPGWGTLMPQAGKLVEAARSRGVDVAADLYVYPFSGTGLSITVPNWVFENGWDKGVALLRQPAIRERLKREVAAGPQPGWSNFVQASGGWDGVILGNAFNPKYDRYRFQSISAIAKQLGRDPADVAWDITLEALPNRAMGLFKMMHEGDIETALRFPWTSIGSDAGSNTKPHGIDGTGNPHPRAYGNFPRVIAEYVKRRPVLTLPDAVRKMTSWPATRLKLYDRGAIRTGLWADVTIFDMDTIDDVATLQRPTEYPRGIDWVLVNGVVAVEDGRYVGGRAGRVLLGPGATGRPVGTVSRKAA